MSNKSENSTEKILLLLGDWATGSAQLQTPKELHLTVVELVECYFCNAESDNSEDRARIVLVKNQLLNLCMLLDAIPKKVLQDIEGRVMQETNRVIKEMSRALS